MNSQIQQVKDDGLKCSVTVCCQVLYSLIAFGVALEQDESAAMSVDPPYSVIRLHLILLLMSTCAFPLNNIDTANKLDYFIIYFQVNSSGV